MKNIIFKSSLLFSVICMSIISCKTDEIDGYNSKKAIFFPKYHPKDTKLIIDSLFVSFSHHPGVDEIEMPFRVSLIGPLLEEDLSYSVVVVDTETTAVKGEYVLPENPIFRKGLAHDTLWVKIKRANLGDNNRLLVLQINENENFELGYYKNTRVKLAFNDVRSQPLWWDKVIVATYFDTYSYEKYQTIILAAKEEGIEFTSTVGLTPTQIREIALIAKDYIAKNNITEVGGKEMKIVAY